MIEVLWVSVLEDEAVDTPGAESPDPRMWVKSRKGGAGTPSQRLVGLDDE